MKPLLLTLTLGLLFIGQITYAQEDKPTVGADGTLEAGDGFVPCSGTNCSACDFVVLGNTAIKWLIGISFLFFAILAVKAGVGLVISRGNPSALSQAKSSFQNAFIGLIIILVAWLLVDTIMRQLVKGNGTIEGYGPWSEVQCSVQNTTTTTANYFDGDEEFVPRVTATGDNNAAFTNVDVAARVQGIRNTPEVTAMVNRALDEQGITNQGLRNIYRALISQESSNCQNKIGPDTGSGRGRAYGCSQFLVATARQFDQQLDRMFVGKTDAQIAQILQTNNQYSIRLGALYYKEALRNYNNNVDFTLASYNGGPGANRQSDTCPGQTLWQCAANGGYAQTRHYVANIKAVAGAL
jgi:Type IV secretion system pilin/Transglycosylase SLT domain